jgi:hypothetical protein
MICFVGYHDVDRRNIQSPVFTEKGDALCLKKVSTYGIYCYRIGSNDQSSIGPDVSLVEEIGAPTVKLGCERALDIEPSLSLHNRVRPDLAQG